MSILKKGVLGGLLVLLVAGGGYFYLNFRSNPKTIFATSINDTYTKMATMFEGFRNSKVVSLGETNLVSSETNLQFAFEGDVDDDSEMAMIAEMLEGLGINVYLEQDMQNQLMYIELDIDFEGEKFIDAKIYAEKDLTYFFVEGLFDKYIGIEDFVLFGDEENNMKELSKEIEYLIEKTKDLFLESLLDEYFEVEKATIEINGQEKKVTKNSFELNDERAREVLKYIITGLKNDQKSIEAIIKITEFNGESVLTKEEIIEEFEIALKEIKEDEVVLGSQWMYDIYTEGFANKPVMHDLTITYKDTFTGDDKETQIIYYELNEEEKTGSYLLNVDGKKVLTIDVLNTNGKSQYNVEVFDNNDVVFKGQITIEAEEEEIEKNQEYKTTWSIKIQLEIDEQELGFAINGETITKVIDEINIPAENLLVRYNDLSEEEQNQIMNDLYNMLSMFGGSETDYDYDYDYDYDNNYEYDYDFDEPYFEY